MKPETLKKKVTRKLALQIKEPTHDRKSLLRNYNQRIKILGHLTEGRILEALYPSDHHSKDDIAFGYLKNNKFVVAKDFVVPGGSEVGYIAHITMLQQLGYAKDETDAHPKVDYLIRGIVKAEMGHDVLFWETPHQLIESIRNFDAMRECLHQLKKRKLVSDDNKVFGSGNGAKLELGTVKSIQKA